MQSMIGLKNIMIASHFMALCKGRNEFGLFRIRRKCYNDWTGEEVQKEYVSK